MELKEFFNFYKDLFIWAPAEWIWTKMHSIKFFTLVYTKIGCHIITILLIIFVYAFMFYVIWCFIAGILDILTYNKRRTVELLAHEKNVEKSINAYNNWVRNLHEQDLSNAPTADPDKNKELFEAFVEVSAENTGLSKRKVRKMLKEEFKNAPKEKDGILHFDSEEDVFYQSLREQGYSEKEIKKIMKK